MKICSHCNQSLPKVAFNRKKATKDGLSSWCAKCSSEHKRAEYLAHHPDRALKVASALGMPESTMVYKDKLCIDCLVEKPVSHFHRKRDAKDGRTSYCIECGKKRSTAWQARNKDRLTSKRAAARKASPRHSLNVTLYGALKRCPTENPATLDDVMRIWAEQEGRCVISGIRMTWAQGKVTSTSMTLDRIDQDGGYSADNIRIVCHAINSFRGRMTDTEMVAMARAIVAKADATAAEPTWNSFASFTNESDYMGVS